MPVGSDFHAWLETLPGLGYERDWIRRNMPALERRFAQDASPMERAPVASVRAQDRYGEL